MSTEVRPQFQPAVRGLVYRAEGKALADCIHRIHGFSRKRGLRSITDFLDNRDMPDEDADYDEWLAARSDWHPPAEGLEAIEALLQAIQAEPRVAQRWNKEDPDVLETLVDDLEELVRCLKVAAAKGVQFRLDIS